MSITFENIKILLNGIYGSIPNDEFAKLCHEYKELRDSSYIIDNYDVKDDDVIYNITIAYDYKLGLNERKGSIEERKIRLFNNISKM